MKVRFLATRQVKDVEGFTFEAGEVYDLSDESAARWIRRGIAEEVPEDGDDRPAVEPKPKAKPKPPKPGKISRE